ncbi:MAG: DnaD domain protein [Bacilli bacterium]|nr:DnaD domain protein [Bacilli bacterium]
MNGNKIVDIFKSGNIVIPVYLLKNYKKLNIKLEEFIFLMYLYNKGNNQVFNPSLFSVEIGSDLETVMSMVSTLADKNYIKVEVRKNDKGLMEDVVNLEDFYSKLSLLVMDEVTKEDSKNSSVFDMIEKEFGRTLSPIEYEIIKAWLDSHISEELIKEALKEATFNGVSNLRYIDKILYEWGKKGIKTKEDVLENKKQRNSKIQTRDNKKIDLDIMDWDWFDDEE